MNTLSCGGKNKLHTKTLLYQIINLYLYYHHYAMLKYIRFKVAWYIKALFHIYKGQSSRYYWVLQSNGFFTLLKRRFCVFNVKRRQDYNFWRNKSSFHNNFDCNKTYSYKSIIFPRQIREIEHILEKKDWGLSSNMRIIE